MRGPAWVTKLVRHFDQRAYSLILHYSNFFFPLSCNTRQMTFIFLIHSPEQFRVIPNAMQVSESDTVTGITLNQSILMC